MSGQTLRWCLDTGVLPYAQPSKQTATGKRLHAHKRQRQRSIVYTPARRHFGRVSTQEQTARIRMLLDEHGGNATETSTAGVFSDRQRYSRYKRQIKQQSAVGALCAGSTQIKGWLDVERLMGPSGYWSISQSLLAKALLLPTLRFA